MSAWNKTIGNNSGGRKQVGTQWSMIWQERLIFRQIPMSGAPKSCPTMQTWIKDSPLGIYCLGQPLEG